MHFARGGTFLGWNVFELHVWPYSLYEKRQQSSVIRFPFATRLVCYFAVKTFPRIKSAFCVECFNHIQAVQMVLVTCFGSVTVNTRKGRDSLYPTIFTPNRFSKMCSKYWCVAPPTFGYSIAIKQGTLLGVYNLGPRKVKSRGHIKRPKRYNNAKTKIKLSVLKHIYQISLILRGYVLFPTSLIMVRVQFLMSGLCKVIRCLLRSRTLIGQQMV